MILFWLLPFSILAHLVEVFLLPRAFESVSRIYAPSVMTYNRWPLIINLIFVAFSVLPFFINVRLAIVFWLFLASILFSNGLLQLRGFIKVHKYEVGMVTSIFLYIPVAVLGYWHFLTMEKMSVKHGATLAFISGMLSSWFYSQLIKRRGQAPKLNDQKAKKLIHTFAREGDHERITTG